MNICQHRHFNNSVTGGFLCVCIEKWLTEQRACTKLNILLHIIDLE